MNISNPWLLRKRANGRKPRQQQQLRQQQPRRQPQQKRQLRHIQIINNQKWKQLNQAFIVKNSILKLEH